jgi:predicted nucleotidyltransferase
MKIAAAKSLIGAVAAWAMARDDVRALALVGSWARGNPRPISDIDLLLLSDRAHEYRRRRKWLSEIDFGGAGYSISSSHGVAYGAVWSRHIHLIPAAEIELTFAEPVWARTAPVDPGTRALVRDALRIMIDKDGSLAKLVRAIAVS